jgi:hypothetical protein
MQSMLQHQPTTLTAQASIHSIHGRHAPLKSSIAQLNASDAARKSNESV